MGTVIQVTSFLLSIIAWEPSAVTGLRRTVFGFAADLVLGVWVSTAGAGALDGAVDR
ncbi:hypothetical protein Vqi01_52810 [Micromonospora qiuiae]|uniref:Uncharacterized protein n=1 Tax=Micromonospora qiuiae TaxID=502268 RepID=A0ABQ4JKX5_9ACTN|nr:hypothetical protein [Micromonospora qiuiae]GIJ30119.1 hypothetical protein Vqi01_52810 [Micromonospora qiuiae]